jgi:hypothetical protein
LLAKYVTIPLKYNKIMKLSKYKENTKVGKNTKLYLLVMVRNTN